MGCAGSHTQPTHTVSLAGITPPLPPPPLCNARTTHPRVTHGHAKPRRHRRRRHEHSPPRPGRASAAGRGWLPARRGGEARVSGHAAARARRDTRAKTHTGAPAWTVWRLCLSRPPSPPPRAIPLHVRGPALPRWPASIRTPMRRCSAALPRRLARARQARVAPPSPCRHLHPPRHPLQLRWGGPLHDGVTAAALGVVRRWKRQHRRTRPRRTRRHHPAANSAAIPAPAASVWRAAYAPAAGR